MNWLVHYRVAKRTGNELTSSLSDWTFTLQWTSYSLPVWAWTRKWTFGHCWFECRPGSDRASSSIYIPAHSYGLIIASFFRSLSWLPELAARARALIGEAHCQSCSCTPRAYAVHATLSCSARARSPITMDLCVVTPQPFPVTVHYFYMYYF